MIKITFMGAGSTVFLRNVLGDCIYTDALKGMEIALYDIDGQRLEQSAAILEAINKGNGCPASIRSYLGAENRRKALSRSGFRHQRNPGGRLRSLHHHRFRDP